MNEPCKHPTDADPQPRNDNSIFRSARSYDRSINWSARLAREMPVLKSIFGVPDGREMHDVRIIDAGCGTGRQTRALAELGYTVVGYDLSDDMLAVAREHAEGVAPERLKFVAGDYSTITQNAGKDFDGIYCLGNALAASGSREVAREAIMQFAACLKSGGRVFIQILNFAPMQKEKPCVRGPRVATVDGREMISTRLFHFTEGSVDITNITIWREDDGWKKNAHTGQGYAVSQADMQNWCGEAGLRIDEEWGSYAMEPFDLETSVDYITVATKK